jgi:hypothetical protein
MTANLQEVLDGQLVLRDEALTISDHDLADYGQSEEMTDDNSRMIDVLLHISCAEAAAAKMTSRARKIAFMLRAHGRRKKRLASTWPI